MTIMSWKEYKSWIEEAIDSKRTYYYRGQRDPSWKLQTTFHRHGIELGYDMLHYLNFIIPDVHYYVCAHNNEVSDLSNPQEFGTLLALLQHNGFPTPLLDWTLSPYVAAYFAYRNVDDKQPQSDHIRIFIFEAQEWEKTFEQPLDLREQKKQYVSLLKPFARNNPNLIAQNGVYTVTNISNMQEHFIASSKEKKKEFIYVVDLSVTERTKVMRDLDLMGINERTMFPGIGGLCRALKGRYFIRETVGLGPAQRNEFFKSMLEIKSKK